MRLPPGNRLRHVNSKIPLEQFMTPFPVLTKLVTAIAIAAFIGGCATQQKKMTGAQAKAARQAQIQQSVPLMSEPPQILVSSKGRRYRVVETTDTQGTESETEVLAGAAGPDNFAGTARKAVKISLLDGVTPESFNSTGALIDALPADETMTNHDPRIDTGPNSQRVEEEKRVFVVSGFLYAAKKESDNDFHLIFGGDPNGADDPAYFTAEVSGLPESGPNRAPLTAARDQFKSFFGSGGGGKLPGTKYVLFDPPVPVTIKGPAFYDTEHAGGVVGPTCCKAQRAWEIHPIEEITFDP